MRRKISDRKLPVKSNDSNDEKPLADAGEEAGPSEAESDEEAADTVIPRKISSAYDVIEKASSGDDGINELNFDD
jgi:hypothetical protein